MAGPGEGFSSRRTQVRAQGEASRVLLLRIVASSPGINRTRIWRKSGLGWGTVTHHLRGMAERSEIRLAKSGRQDLHFPPSSDPSHLPRLAVLSKDHSSDILAALRASPGRGIQEIATALGRSRKTVRRLLGEMVRVGLVTKTESPRPRFGVRAGAAGRRSGPARRARRIRQPGHGAPAFRFAAQAAPGDGGGTRDVGEGERYSARLASL